MLPTDASWSDERRARRMALISLDANRTIAADLAVDPLTAGAEGLRVLVMQQGSAPGFGQFFDPWLLAPPHDPQRKDRKAFGSDYRARSESARAGGYVGFRSTLGPRQRRDRHHVEVGVEGLHFRLRFVRRGL